MRKMLPVLRVVALLMLPLPLLAEGESKPLPFPPGDARLCLGREPGLLRFEVLPGTGWDNLQNKESANVVAYNYSRCKTTDDGRYLLPDGVDTIPVKSSSLQRFAEVITHWNSFTSTTAKSINVEAGVSFKKFAISGKFSDEHSNFKKHMLQDKLTITRAQIRYVHYTARLKRNQPLDPVFRSHLLCIASHLQQNQTEHARYAAQLLVRNFGTHVITSMDAGAIIVQTDQIKWDFNSSKTATKHDIAAAASASFFDVFEISSSYKDVDENEMVDEYKRIRKQSTLESEGGPLLTEGMTLKTWSEAVDKDLVAVDRHGDPLWFQITQQTLPELSASLIYNLTKTVREAVDLYYDFNTYRGCTRQDAPNFSPAANEDDGTCKGPLTNLTLGGVFVTCDQISDGAGDLCSEKKQVNPKTGGYFCPRGYTAVKLHSSYLKAEKIEGKSSANLVSYWCAAKDAEAKESGFLFGGLYTPGVVNPVTDDQSCPAFFNSFRMGNELMVCLSDDFELGSRYSVPFGGFFSCAAGNPLAINCSQPKVYMHYFQAGPHRWPMHCPQGYSQHLADVEQGCSINYCVESGMLSHQIFLPIRRPPYISLPEAPVVDEASRPEAEVVVEATTPSVDNQTTLPPYGGASQKGLNLYVTLGVVLGLGVCVLIFVALIIFVYRRRRKTTQYDEPRAEDRRGTVGSEVAALTVL